MGEVRVSMPTEHGKRHHIDLNLGLFTLLLLSDELHATYRLAINQENLWFTDLIGGDGFSHASIIPVAQLLPVRRDEFQLNGANLVFRFTRGKKDEVTGFVLNGFRERGMLFARMRGKN